MSNTSSDESMSSSGREDSSRTVADEDLPDSSAVVPKRLRRPSSSNDLSKDVLDDPRVAKKRFLQSLPTPEYTSPSTSQSREERTAPYHEDGVLDNDIVMGEALPPTTSKAQVPPESSIDVPTEIHRLAPPLQGNIVWQASCGGWWWRGTTDGGLSIMDTRDPKKASELGNSLDRKLAVLPASRLAVCSGATCGTSLVDMSLVISCEDIFQELDYDSASETIRCMTYHIKMTRTGLQVAGSREKVADTIAFNGRFSAHGLYDGEVELSVYDWEQGKHCRLDFDSEEILMAAQYTPTHLFIISTRAIHVFEQAAIQEACVSLHDDDVLIPATHRVSVESLGIHKVWHAAIRCTGAARQSVATFVLKDGHRLSAYQLHHDPDGAYGYTVNPLWNVLIDTAVQLRALSIDEQCMNAVWMQARVRDEGVLEQFEILRKPLNDVVQPSFPPVQVHQSSTFGPMIHCDIIFADNASQAILVAERYSTVAFLLEGEQHDEEGDARASTTAWTGEVVKLEEERSLSKSRQVITDQEKRPSWATKNVSHLDDVELAQVLVCLFS
ncbi:hypothetical protein CALCODRAFT_512185 [Calocera cornea HHB12733]|uniref:Uncharacterized protein n=1 Tax=Calocera cornea HHB12733 TaxID=1353952 RepID=A0A165D7N6_9BASI|nr:hypothetical protein CALCODRAFT_512185 [Calocera cornea HHB12733]